MDAAINDDLPPLDHELAYLRDQVQRFLTGGWPLGDPLSFIGTAEETLEASMIADAARQQLPPLARRALVGALVARARTSADGDLENELDYYVHAVRRTAEDHLRTPSSDPPTDIATALAAARRAQQQGDPQALENALLDAAGQAIAWKLRLG